mgnify:CR=1 FL=1
MKFLSKPIYILMRSIKNAKKVPSPKKKIDIKGVTKPPEITIKESSLSSDSTIKSNTVPSKAIIESKTNNEFLGQDILAEQNKVLISINNVSRQNQANRRVYQNLCDKGFISQSDTEALVKTFKDETGLNLYCSGNVRQFNATLSVIADEVKAGKFPKDKIKHILIGHGTGNIEDKNWCTADGPILKYINSNPKMEKRDLVLVACCETNGKRVAGKPAKGHQVELTLCDNTINHENRGPAKIIHVGEEDICGQYSIIDGFKLY